MKNNNNKNYIVKMTWFLQGTRIYNFFHAEPFVKLNVPLDRA